MVNFVNIAKRNFKRLSQPDYAKTFLCMHLADERRRYTVTPSLIGWAHAQNNPCHVYVYLFRAVLTQEFHSFENAKCMADWVP